jgi:hypothetical protein
VDSGFSASLGGSPYPRELYGVHAAIMPGDLGVPIEPGDAVQVAEAA